MDEETGVGAGPAERAPHAGGDGPAPTLRRRMSPGRKREAVVRLLRGEDLELVSRGLGVTAAELSGWGDAFLAAGEAGAGGAPAGGRGGGPGGSPARGGASAAAPPRRCAGWRDRAPEGEGRRADD